MKNYSLLFTSQNNYRCWDDIVFSKSSCDFSNEHIINIDVNSTEAEKDFGKGLCDKYNIQWLDTNKDNRPAQHCIQHCIDYFDKNEIKKDWIIWVQHDSYITDNDFFQKIENVCKNELYLNHAGLIGTNVTNYNKLGRCNLLKDCFNTTYAGWYQNLPREYYGTEYFVVESCMWTIVLINVNLWKKYINPDKDFYLFYSFDDIAHQFMLNNIFTITIPSIETKHQTQKFYGTSSNRNPNHFPEFSQLESPENRWFNKWKWSWGYTKASARDEFIKSGLYDNTLQKKLYDLNISDGPKTINDFL